jgi:mono/diheme cytochrome c family protein
MRKFLTYFLALWALSVVAIVSVAGLRGGLSRKPPLEVFPDMDRQPKLRPQTTAAFAGFADGQSSRLHVPGTVSREAAREMDGFNSGKNADGSWVDAMPVKVTAELVARGRERYTIYCTPCHGAAGDGNGVTTKFGMAAVAKMHDERLIKMADGEIFNTISNGKNLMLPYADKLDAQDRWAVIAYVRALQLSRLGKKEEIPDAVRANLK